jgi:hypothetical protein
MIPSDEKIQADLITKLKSITSVTTVLPEGVGGIKELQWQGDTFQYPAVRLDLEDCGYEFDEQEECGLYFAEFSVFVFSEERSSKQCSTIKGLLEVGLTGKGWTGVNAKYNRLRLVENIPAVRQDERTWRSQLRYRTRLTSP